MRFPRATVFHAQVTALLVLLSALFLLPFLWQLRSSVMTISEIFASPPRAFPHVPQWRNYVEVFSIMPFARYYFNSVFIVVVNIIGALFSNTIIAYGLARLKFRGRKLMFSLSIGTLMMPTSITLLPLFIEWHFFRGINTFFPLTVLSFFGNALFIFMLVQFFRTIPLDFDEAAFIDGANYPQILLSIIVPITRPALAVVAIFTFLGSWNDYLGPLLYLNERKLYTLALGLQAMLSQYTSDWHLLMAAATLVTAPLIILFFLAQKSFVAGLTMGGIKA
jgi:multiple sugar transport system permease protein